MSKHLQHFVDNFLKGAMLGSHWLDMADRRSDRKEQRDIAREKNRIDAERYKQRSALDTRRVSAYEQDIANKGAGVGYYNRNKGGGGAAGATLSPQSQGFIEDMNKIGLDATPAAAPDQPQTQVIQAEQDQPTAEPPPISSDDGYARGGRVRGRQLATSMMQAGAGAAKAAQQKPAGTPPFNPNPTPVPTISRGPSTPLTPSAGTNGPGSGFGETPAPPVTAAPTEAPDMAIQPTYDPSSGGTYKRGGRIPKPRVPHFAEGGEVEGRDWGSLFPTRTPAEPSVPDDPAQALSAAEARDVLQRAAEEKRARATGNRNQVRPGPMSTPDDGGLVDRAYRNDSTVFPPTSDEGRAQLVDSDRARRDLGNLTRFGQTTSRLGTGETGGTPYVPDRPARDVGETGGTPLVERDAPRGDSPDQYYQDDPRTKYKPWATNPKTGDGMPIGSGGPGGGGGGAPRQAIRPETPWKGLRDQTRTEAYDPQRDALDQYNIAAVDREGRTQPHVGGRAPVDGNAPGATASSGRTAPSGQVDVRGPAQGDLSSNNATADYKSDAVNYAHAVAQNGGGPSAVYHDSTNVPDQQTMMQIMKMVDPDGKMPTSQRMELAAKTAHEWYLSQGDRAGAVTAVGEITQFGVNQSRNHGVQAAKLAQSGNFQGAVQQLIAGYDWLPNGQHASVQGNQIVVVDKNGKPTMNIPLDPKTVLNLSLGMATGKLGWDVMGYQPEQQPGGQQPPGAVPQGPAPPAPSRPAAQPQAAPAGPAQTPAAPQQAIQPTMGRYMPPTTPPPGSTPDVAPTQPTAPPPTTPQGSSTPPPPTATPSQPGQKPTEAGAQIQDPEREFYEKNPRGVAPIVDRQTATPDHESTQLQQQETQLRAQMEKDRQAIMLRLKQRGVPLKEIPKVLGPAMKSLEARYTPQIKELAEQRKEARQSARQQEQFDRQRETEPRPQPSSGELAQVQANMQTRLQAVDKDPELRKNKALENLKTPADRQQINDLALSIWQQNKNMTPEKAMDAALGLTAITPETHMGYNYGKGEDALQFRARRNQRQGFSLNTRAGNVLADRETFNAIHDLQKKNWRAYSENKQKGVDQAAKDKGHAIDIGKVGQAIWDLYPKIGGLPIPP
jgi:hypothetical protein